MTLTHRRPHLLATALACALLAACSGGNEVADITTVAPAPSSAPSVAVTTRPEPSAVATSEAATTVPDTTVATPATTAADDGLTGPMFSDALGVKVDSAPGVRTRGDTRQLLPEGLFVHIAWEPDPQDPSVFTVQPDDVAILEAYTNAVMAFYRTATTDLVVDPAEFEPYMVDSGAQFEQSLEGALAGGFVDTLGTGVYLRPYVLADQRTPTSAVIFDCTVSDEAFVLRAAPAREGSEPVQRGQLATMVLIEGRWKVEAFVEEPTACL
jgi:hypothetical protein